jgi:hypothetical protein
VNEKKDIIINRVDLLYVLSQMFGETINHATYQTETLHGGTVAEVILVLGVAQTINDNKYPYKVVLKRQRLWKRPFDDQSWRREYDLYTSKIDLLLTASLHIPKCYLATLNENETNLWIEYVEGPSGEELTVDMLEHIAYELGYFQGMTISMKPNTILLDNVSDIDFLKNELTQWYHQTYDYAFLCSKECRLPNHVKDMLMRNSWNDAYSIIYHYLRSNECNIPTHLKEMILEIDNNIENIFDAFQNLPIVVNHRDFWIENIIYQPNSIFVFDWDCVGWGYLGEDLASLIGDDTPTEKVAEYFERLVPAYNKGLNQHTKQTSIQYLSIIQMILIKYGYRLIQNHMFSSMDKNKIEIVKRLQTMFEIQQKNNIE